MADKRTKSLAVFDIDGTVMDHFAFLAAAGEKVVAGMATSRGLTAEEFKRRARDEAMEKLADSSGKTNLFFDVYGNPGDLVGKLDFMQPDQSADALYAHDFRRAYADMVEFFPDVARTFQDITLDETGQRNGVKVAFLTDGTTEATALKLAVAAKKVDDAGVLPAGVRFLDMVDGIYAQAEPAGSSAPAMPVSDPGLAPYLAEVRAKTVALPHVDADGEPTIKPNPGGLRQVLDDFGKRPDKAIMIGDSHVDIGVADACGMDSAWQKHGCDASIAAVHYNDTLGFAGYKLGVEAVSSKLDKKGLAPTMVLENGVSDLGRGVDFAAAEPDIAVTLKAAQPTRTRPGLTQAV